MNENEYLRKFSELWPVERLGDREEALWDELDALIKLKKEYPDAEAFNEKNGIYFLERGVELFRVSLKIIGLCNVDSGRISEKEVPILKLYLDEQEEILVNNLKEIGFSYTDENLLWELYGHFHPEADGAVFFWNEFAKLWLKLTGRKICPDLSHKFVRSHFQKVLNSAQSCRWNESMMEALENVGSFNGADPYCYHEGECSVEDALADSSAMYETVIENGDEEVLGQLIKRGFFTRTAAMMIFNRIETNTCMWAWPYLAMAGHMARKEQ